MTSHNIPKVQLENLFTQDPLGEAFFSHWMTQESFLAVRHRFVTMGRNAVLAVPLSDRADKQGPFLKTHNAQGERVDQVVYHPDYHKLEELGYGGGIVSVKYDPAFLLTHHRYRHLVGFGLGYYFGQTESGLFCPICMTDGVGRVLERHAPKDLARETIAHLASTHRGSLWQGAMFLTERQGGSDVGANTVSARREGDKWLLNGDKWFCSNVDAEAILALARMPNAPEGTRGIGLFLVLRHRPENNGASIRIHRLKDKLGVRSMPTGEVTFENTQAFLIGGVGEGFKQMAEMLNLSRLYNAVASVAGMRRAIFEALSYGSQRRAFGKHLWDLPLWRSSMADLVAEFMASFVMVFETVQALDRADLGDESSRRLVRLTTPMSKALAGKAAMFTVSESMEAIGGNAYIEESIMPRLLRDCQVLPIWEGTTNVLTLDSMRAIRKERSHEALLTRIQVALDRAEQGNVDGVLIRSVQKRVSKLSGMLGELASQPDESQQRGSREWLELAGRCFSLALLAEAASDPALRGPCLAAFKRVDARSFATAPLSGSHAIDLASTEEELLKSAFSDPLSASDTR